jgi:hypothetical protein
MIWLATLLLAAASAPGPKVDMFMDDDMLRMVRGSGSIRLIYRNVGPLELIDLRLATTTQTPVTLEPRPGVISRCQPADRCVFVVDAKAVTGTPERRFFVELILSAAGAEIHRAPLLVDASPRAAVRERGWMDAGSVQVGERSQTTRVVVLTLLAAVPVLLLLGLGWWFKRRAARGAG